jgi:hypothetical protein
MEGSGLPVLADPLPPGYWERTGGAFVAVDDEKSPAGISGAEPEEVLWAKYLDFCSAQVADILLLLSPDEMFVLAQDAAREAGVTGDLGYETIVALATERVSKKLALPEFDIWARDYQENPGRYDQYLMGFWETEVPRRPDG